MVLCLFHLGLIVQAELLKSFLVHGQTFPRPGHSPKAHWPEVLGGEMREPGPQHPGSPLPFSRGPLQPVPGQGQQGAHSAGWRHRAHHQLPVQSQRGDGVICSHHTHVPKFTRHGLPSRTHLLAPGPVHAALFSLSQHTAPEPGPDLPRGLLLPKPGG